jgi:hypothetical protein
VIDKILKDCPFLKLTRETGGIIIGQSIDGKSTRSTFNLEELLRQNTTLKKLKHFKISMHTQLVKQIKANDRALRGEEDLTAGVIFNLGAAEKLKT